MVGTPPQETAQMVIIMYPFYLDLRSSSCLFLKLMDMKERRQDQNLADIKVGEKCWAATFFANIALWKSNKTTNMDIYPCSRCCLLSKGKFISIAERRILLLNQNHKKKENTHERR